MHINPATSSAIHGCIGRDALLVMPVRRASLTTVTPEALSAWQDYGYISESCPCIGGYKDKEPNRRRSILCISSEDRTSNHSLPGVGKKCVRFAPERSTSTSIIIGLDDYTDSEHEACWYSRQELDVMLHHEDKPLHRDARWNPGSTLDHMYDTRMWSSKISSKRTKA